MNSRRDIGVHQSPESELPLGSERVPGPMIQPRGNAAMQDAMRREGADASGPFEPWLNATLSACFGRSLAGLEVERGNDRDNQALGAAAHTVDHRIVLSSQIKEVGSDPFSMDVIGHEVAHALAGVGVRQDPIDQAGDPGEGRADQAGAGFSAYMSGRGGRTPDLQVATGGRAAVHRYQVALPLGAMDKQPVHENLTLLTIQQAMNKNSTGKYGDLLNGVNKDQLPDEKSGVFKKYGHSVDQFVRGVVWPDDPQCLMFNDTKHMNYSTGILAGTTFTEAEALSKEGKPQTTLMGRSHYGDLQYLHGMASQKGEDPKDTKAKMLAWSKFNILVATGKITSTTKLSDIKEIQGMFTGTAQQDFTVQELFSGNLPNGDKLTDEDIKQRAVGTLLHLVQDSHAEGHVERDPKTGAIIQFHTYGDQDGHKHDGKDAFGSGATLQDKVDNTPGANAAITEGAELLTMMDQGVSTEEIMQYMDQKVLALSPDAKPAAAGEEFEKDEPAAQVAAAHAVKAVAPAAAQSAAREGGARSVGDAIARDGGKGASALSAPRQATQ